MITRGFKILTTKEGSYDIVACLISLVISVLPFFSRAQENIPLGTWRLHLSYNRIISIAEGDDQIFAATESGILIYDKAEQEISSLNSLSGLKSSGITCIAYDKSNDQLLVAYQDGDLDIVHDGTISNFDRLKQSTSITTSKKINHISIRNNLAYLSMDFGIVVFDLNSLELKETWRDLGPSGDLLAINKTTFVNDSIFVATDHGVIAGDLNDNLLDFNHWVRYDDADFTAEVVSVAILNNAVYAAIDNNGLFKKVNGSWMKSTFFQNVDFHSVESGKGGLLVIAETDIRKMISDSFLQVIDHPLIVSPLTSLEDEHHLWIGDAQNGLISNLGGDFTSIIPNGPPVNSAFSVDYHNGKIYLLSGGFSESGEALELKGDLNVFENGVWSVISKSMSDLTDIEFIGDETFISSFGDGLEASASGASIIIDDTNSPLENLSSTEKQVNISSIQSTDEGLWVANYGADHSLHFLQGDTWQSFSLASGHFPTQIDVDFFGNVWMVLDPAKGGGVLVFNKESNTSVFLTDDEGNGGLPSQSVFCIAVDREGLVWLGTEEGVVFFFSPEQDAFKPIFENRPLLRDEKITAIAVDGGNRKWIGTEHGVWLFTPSGEELILNFDIDNSPLPSNSIRDIAIHGETGEVFISTDNGIISYRADATSGDAGFQKLKIFPNPVTADFSGMVGISGLATDAIVKITDISGNLIWETKANGGTASWNVRNYNGVRASTGIYLVFAATEDGSESVVGKIAVIE